MFYPTVIWLECESQEEMQAMYNAVDASEKLITQEAYEEGNAFSVSPMYQTSLTEVDQELSRIYSEVVGGRVRDSHKCSAKHVMGVVDSYKRKNRK